MPPPQRITWAQAPDHIAAAAQRLGSRVVVVGITGPVGAGKSLLASRLTPCILSTDNYLPDYEAIPYHQRDLPQHTDHARLARDLAALRAGQPIQSPLWSFQTHRREGFVNLAPAPIIACEGIHALHAPIAALLDLKVFVEAPRAVRWTRWELLERSGQRGWGIEKARKFFDEVAEPTFSSAEQEYRARADIIVENG